MDNRFSIGSVLGNGFRIWFKNLIPFVIISALLYMPLVVWGVTLANAEQYDLFTWFKKYEAFAYASFGLGFVTNIFISAALTYGVVMELQGQHASLISCVTTGFSRFFPVLGVALLTGLAFVGGLLALLVPGIILYCMLYVAPQAAVLERVSATAALGRSRDLTSGKKMELFGLVFILVLIKFGVGKVIETTMLDPSAVTNGNVFSMLRRFIYVNLAAGVVLGSLTAVMASVAYFQLRNEKEGTSADELAAVFE